MSAVGAAVATVLLFALLAFAFMRVEAAKLALALRVGGPVFLVVCGLGLLAGGVAAVGGVFFAAGLAWGTAAGIGPREKSARRKSSIRTAALEMELDHRTGALEAVVLAGTFEGKLLSRLQWVQLRRLYGELASDVESRQLLEAYLDGRFPGWRKDAQANVDRGHRIAPGPGAMTKEEAYKVLGLEAGAAPADVRKAHRRLLQRLRPDAGRPSVLALRIDKAKNVLLSDQD